MVDRKGLMSKNECILMYKITHGQINRAVYKKRWPKMAMRGAHGGALYKICDIEKYFEDFPLRLSTRSVACIRDRRSIYYSEANDYNRTLENERIEAFNKRCAEFIISMTKRNIVKTREPECEDALINKYRKSAPYTVHLHDRHEQFELREIDAFSAIHDCHHRMI